MNKRNLLSTILSCSILATTTLPSFALEANSEVITEEVSQESTTKNNDLEVIVVRFNKNMSFDVGANKKVTTTLYTVEPIHNNNGEIVIPPNTRVHAVLKPVGKGKDRGSEIHAKFLVINGKKYTLNAISNTKIPAYKIKKKSRLEQSEKYGSSFAKPFSGSNSPNSSADSQTIRQNARAVGSIIGFLSPHSKLISSFSKDEIYMLDLKKPLSLDTIKNIPTNSSESETTQEEDTPTNSSESETIQEEDTPTNSSESETTQEEDTPANSSESETTQEEDTPANSSESETTQEEDTPTNSSESETTQEEDTPANSSESETTQEEDTPTNSSESETTQEEDTPATTPNSEPTN
ncbi:MAG: hypothetical protein AAF316_11725 [Cyanobacteria bacterium P01_A01_bin.80]